MKRLTQVIVVVAMLSFTILLHAEEPLKSTIDDQVNVEVTVYNSNLGLVKDTRKIKLPKADSKELRFMDVAQQINPVTVHPKSLNFPDNFKVLEQNYEYDLLSPEKLLDKYVGKDITLIDENKYLDTSKTLKAKLLSNNNGQIYKIGNEIYLGHGGLRVLPEIPENMIAKPTLMWLYASDVNKEHEIQVSYMTGGISWKADYVMILDKDDVNADLSGWVTVDNRSGTMYKNAKLKLMAGEVNRVQPQLLGRSAKGLMMMDESVASNGGFVEQGLFEYHMYDLQRRTDIKNNQTKQISLLEANGISVSKELRIDSQPGYLNLNQGAGIDKLPVNVFVKFKNEEKNKLGMPLPAGVIRLYKKDAQESLQFIGEDRINHTPKDEDVELKVGRSFDVVAEKKQTDYKKVTTRINESAWEISIRNHKDEDVEVKVVQEVKGYSNWSILYSNAPYDKKDAFSIEFKIKVPKDGEYKLNYRVRVER